MHHLLWPASDRTAVAGLAERVLAANPPSLSASYGATRPPADVAALARHAEAVAQVEAEIDAHVYRLYGLTKDEIKLVEESASAGR